MKTNTCPNCCYEFSGAATIIKCDVCDKDCCASCAEYTAQGQVICDQCLEKETK